MSEWHEELDALLIHAGITGLKQRDIVIRFNGRITGADIEEYLEALRSEEKVQKFKLPSGPRGGRSATVWRGTTKLLGD